MNYKLMRDVLTVQKPVDVDDGQGGRMRTWERDFDIYAQVTPAGADEQLITDGKQHVISHQVMTRYRPDITPKKRFLLGSRVLEIESIIDIEEKRRMLQIQCLEEA